MFHETYPTGLGLLEMMLAKIKAEKWLREELAQICEKRLPYTYREICCDICSLFYCAPFDQLDTPIYYLLEVT